MDDAGHSDGLGLVVARRRRRRRGARAVRWFVLPLLAVVVLAAGLGAAALTVFARDPAALVGCDLGSTRPSFLGANTSVYAADGSRLGLVPSPWNRHPVPLAAMGRWLPRAAVAIEDRRFWTRDSAIDLESILRAAVADMRAGSAVQGGSTIPQQLVRDRYLRDNRPVLSRKLEEACLAVQLYRRTPKRRILEAYLNEAFYAHHAYGVDAAARTYFSRPPRRLTLPQAALIAGLPQAPSLFDPVQHPRAAVRRRNQVLRAMAEAGDISHARLETSLRHRLVLHPTRRFSIVHSPGFFSAARRELVRRYGLRRARRGGLRVTTTLDPHLQDLALGALRRWLAVRTDPAGAVVAIDPSTGAVRALAVRTPGLRGLHFNLATQSRRQAGSTFKTFTLTAAMRAGIPLSSVWNGPSSLLIPDRICYTGTGPWTVHNYADEQAGTMTLLDATAHSVNTIFAQVALKVGLRRVVATAHALGVRSPLAPVCSLTLGPEGVSPLEMTDAFATLANRGMHHAPQVLARVEGPRGDVLGRLRRAGDRAIPASVAERVTYALEGVIRSGTGTAAALSRPAAGKTGTAESFKDAWFCGFVPQLATCVWIGHPHAEAPMAGVDGFEQVVGGSVPARIWHDFMTGALAGVPVRPLPSAPPAVSP